MKNGIHNLRSLCFFSVILICLFFVSSPAGAQIRVEDQGSGFILELPPGWVPRPDFVRTEADIIHAFRHVDASDLGNDFILLIKQLPGTIGREPLTESMMPAGFQGSLFKTHWQDFEVDGFEVPENANGTNTLTLNVQIPLKNRAVQVMLYGLVEQEEELYEILPGILSGLKGKSNWQVSPSPASTASQKNDKPFILITLAGLFLILGLILLWLVSKNAPRGTALAIAGVIFAIGFLLSVGQTREALLIKGSLQLLGSAGLLLGLVDALKKRET